MEIPENIINEAKQRIEPYAVEGFVLGKGDQNSDIMVVGEAPGENEAVKGVPFIGRAGKELDKQFNLLGWDREKVYITSVVRSRPYRWVEANNESGQRKANRKPNQKEIIAHAPLLDYQIRKVDPSVIVALGGVAFKRLTGGEQRMSDVVGEVFETRVLCWDIEGGQWSESERTYEIIPLYHPAAVFYNPKIRAEIESSLEKVRDYLGQNRKK
ncbi:uracil-DNA glycosylase [Halobacillus locisalis]|uniref:Uracil-DNA glycosylase n=1 Tax=Halobacillus locisalis TaxID=220753 RepID=A0A838CXQ9_9BACI|nr:uracil-DNA glycosylase [Halobacillus locisalis]MBA2176714.1 uracil-DNA glycosylase [Halobacillus locisalis]